MIQLDTSFLIRAFVPDSKEDLKLREWLRRGERVGVSAIAWAELSCGPIERGLLELALGIVGEPEPFGRPYAALAAGLFNRAGRRRGSLLDCMIAASAIGAGGSLATANPDDFSRFVSERLSVLTA
jgi:predicted nucleic acid-binding protein